ncbi:unnamed protein product [Hermetia illucens]|uniref:Phosphomevalonate kinase n=1 Tax=Hermetia illucens TaxID=343691 RepID=A0A7R8USN2_HERIL|nr:probable phosphomevalonate kinase [Hermetia illucens]CAD7086246.1 unnamed protein product [Hermetia illucens]
MENIELIILFTGKRKCGKDFICERLNNQLQPQLCEIIRISEPIKSEWAKKLNLDLQMLLSDGPYKEKYRKDMIDWSDEIRAKDYGFFCRKAIQKATKKIIIVSDIRRRNDIKYFRDTFDDRIRTVRVSCPDEVRIARGWKFQSGVDDVESECGLDDYTDWDLKIMNDGSVDVNQIIEQIVKEFKLDDYLII